MDDTKSELRGSMLQSRNRLDASTVKAFSSRIAARLKGFPAFSDAGAFGCYLSFGKEVDTHGLLRWALEHGKRVAVPRTAAGRRMDHVWLRDLDDFQALRPMAFGILEPGPSAPVADVAQLDLLLVPGVAFTPDGDRLGMGGGYYDRYLAGLSLPLVGLAYGFQILPRLPAEAHDRRVDYVATEDGVITCGRGGSA